MCTASRVVCCYFVTSHSVSNASSALSSTTFHPSFLYLKNIAIIHTKMPVLGKRARNASPSPTTPKVLTRRANTNHNRRDFPTPDPTPNPKRPRPLSSILSTSFDDDSNKENIPPKLTDTAESRSRTRQHILPQPHPSPPATPETANLARSRAALRLQGQEDNAPLIGREQERSVIHNFLDPFLTDTADGESPFGLYISGAPGTGKTALINEFISSISASHADSVRVISINCMALERRELTGVWERCAEEFHLTDDVKRTSSVKIDWPKQFAKLPKDKKW